MRPSIPPFHSTDLDSCDLTSGIAMNAAFQTAERPGAAVSNTPLLEMRCITKSFPGVRALDNVNIALYPGKVTALIGENGAGKSTLVKILTVIYRPGGGEIRIDNSRGQS